MPGFFVTGTDTGVGKTYVSAQLLRALRAQGLHALAMKPIASGAIETAEGLRNDDAVCLQQAASENVAYEIINPFVFAPAIAPSIAASLLSVEIDPNQILDCYRQLQARAQLVLVEGVGGWRVPLSDELQTVDLVRRLGLSVIMVVGLRLGCINHAILTAEAIQRDGLRLFGWYANIIEPKLEYQDENIATLSRAISAPMLGVIPYSNDMPSMSTIDISQLLPSLTF